MGVLMKKKIILATSLVVVIAIAVTAAVLTVKNLKNEKEDDIFKNMSEIERLGYEALKINGTYVSTDVFREEYNKF